MDILHLCTPSDIGGLERVVQELASGQVGAGHRVRVVGFVEPGSNLSPFIEPLIRAGVDASLHQIGARSYLRELGIVGRLLRDDPPDVVHTHGYRSDILDGWTARRHRIPIVSTLHGSSRMGGLSHLFELLQEFTLRRFDAVVAVSAPLRHDLISKGASPDRVHLIPNTVSSHTPRLPRSEARRRLSASDGVFTMGWVGRLIPIKGCDVFLRALSGLTSSGWEAVILGDGPERGRLEALSHELGLTDRVRFLGAVPHAARLFEGFDLFVLSSRSEGTPMVVLEALAASRPVVATNVGGIADMLPSEQGDWLVENEASEDLSRALDDAVQDPARSEIRGKAAARFAEENFGYDRWIARHLELYARVADLPEPQPMDPA